MKILKFIQGVVLFFLLTPVLFAGGFFASFFLILGLILSLPFLILGILIFKKHEVRNVKVTSVILLPQKLEFDEEKYSAESNLIFFSDLAKKMHEDENYKVKRLKVSTSR